MGDEESYIDHLGEKILFQATNDAGGIRLECGRRERRNSSSTDLSPIRKRKMSISSKCRKGG